MNWTENKPPKENESWYDHCDLETPLGKLRVEWKSWKECPSFDIYVNEEYI